MKVQTMSIGMILRSAWIVLLLGNLARGAEVAQVRELQSPNPTSVLFIGNSFFYHNGGLNEHLLKLIRSEEPSSPFRVTAVTISGAGLDWHDVGSYFRPDAIGRYSFDSDNNIVFNKTPKHLFDVAVMMDCSQCPVFPPLQKAFRTAVAKDSAIVRHWAALPVLFMSWAYENRPEMTQQLADAYTAVGNENDDLVIPAGLAFANSIKRYPDIKLYDADKRHPSLAGTYLATCTTYAALFNKSPSGLKYYAGLGADTARRLQAVAWDTVQTYLHADRN